MMTKQTGILTRFLRGITLTAPFAAGLVAGLALGGVVLVYAA